MMVKGKQITVIGLVLVVVTLLFSPEIKESFKEEGQHSGDAVVRASQWVTVSPGTDSSSAKESYREMMSLGRDLNRTVFRDVNHPVLL
ncbi:hypothetical protein [Arcticibacter sp. MXS-1]|uniref:hypothetical protein n=1 Tax=Arcticibacter sp. MXS-1 TaxID=3341726 RepID=UPI0035A8B8FA